MRDNLCLTARQSLILKWRDVRVVEGARLEIALTICDGVLQISTYYRCEANHLTAIASRRWIAVNFGEIFAESTGSRHSYVTVDAALKEHAFRRVASGRLRPNDQVHVTVEHLRRSASS